MLNLLVRHEETPLIAKAILYATLCYALSPIDLIPDFIPVIGLVDDLILLPALIALAIKLTPKDVTMACRLRAQEPIIQDPYFQKVGTLIILAIWMMGLGLLWYELGISKNFSSIPPQDPGLNPNAH